MSEIIEMKTKQDVMNHIESDKPVYLLNAIISGTNMCIKDKVFIEAVKKATKKRITLLNIPISSVAYAALDILEVSKYSGDDKFIISLIESKLDVF